MDLGFEAAKGAAEKVTGVKLPIFMRLVLPGLLATAVLYPAVARLLKYFPFDSDHLWQRPVSYAVLVFLSGALISTANDEIYKIYEGRTCWPPPLRLWAIKRQQARIDKLKKAAATTSEQTVYNELSSELRVYPTGDTGQRVATHPTMIGNILAGYEQYPNTRYGMDSVFYWTRIWLQMDKDKKEDIDSQWSIADGFLTLSAISFVATPVWAAQALSAALFSMGTNFLPLHSAGYALLASPGWLVLGYFWYRLSLPFHRQNGEIFKAIFDLYREKVRDMTALRPHEQKTWKAAWAYLQYLALKCPNCRQYTTLADKCDKCGFGLAELRRNLDETGRFPTDPNEQ